MTFQGNPYVGPRTFTPNEKEIFFGREIEQRELLSLIVSEQLILFYAQSGAGKSSLINAGILPELEARNFVIYPIGRVSGEIPTDIDIKNVFTFNLALSLDRSEEDASRFSRLTLTEFLKGLSIQDDGKTFAYTNNITEINFSFRQVGIDKKPWIITQSNEH